MVVESLGANVKLDGCLAYCWQFQLLGLISQSAIVLRSSSVDLLGEGIALPLFYAVKL